MGDVISQIMLSVDGNFEGANGDIGWHRVDEEHDEYAAQLLDSAGAILFGRATYELMAGYWPTDEAAANDPAIAERMNRLPKIVFSRTLNRVSWHNASLSAEVTAETIMQLKRQYGQRHLVILGSARLVSSFAALGLVDEYHIVVNPVVLGAGAPFFRDFVRMPLELLTAQTFRSGNVLLRYRPESAATTSC